MTKEQKSDEEIQAAMNTYIYALLHEKNQEALKHIEEKTIEMLSDSND